MDSFKLETDAIQDNGFFDPRYTCDVDNSSPEMRWDHLPENTVSLALIADDLDHPKQMNHWVVFNIPTTVLHLPAGVPAQELLPNGIRQGLNGLGKLGYAGPCPSPKNSVHTYRFKLFAISTMLDTRQRLTRDELLEIITPHVIAITQLEGRYQRLMDIAS